MRDSMEGRLYVCRAARIGNGYRVWVRGRPRLAAKGPTFEAADERLWQVIGDATGDFESERVYETKAAPQKVSAIQRNRAVMLVGSRSARITNHRALFSRGLCGTCGMGVGQRTSVAARLSRWPAEVALATADGFTFARESFLALLTHH